MTSFAHFFGSAISIGTWPRSRWQPRPVTTIATRHTHGVVDPSIATTERGIWAIKWSFAILALTALFQLVVVYLSGSVALFADTIHNIGDAGTAIPLWVAFVLARRKPTARFTYGYGRVEDLAGIVIVLIILFSALVAGYEAIHRLIAPRAIEHLGAVAAAGVIGFLGNEAVAVFRIRVGSEINSAALVADGYHARTDGLTSLAVVLGAAGVWLGFPLADPIVGLLITVAIFGIVWQSSKAVLTRMLDGVEPDVTEEIRHAAEHVPGARVARREGPLDRASAARRCGARGSRGPQRRRSRTPRRSLRARASRSPSRTRHRLRPARPGRNNTTYARRLSQDSGRSVRRCRVQFPAGPAICKS